MIEYEWLTVKRGALNDGIGRLHQFLSRSGASREPRTVKALSYPFFYTRLAKDIEKAYPENFAGMASIYFIDLYWRIKAEIHDVVVDPSYRRQGIARRLVGDLIVLAREHSKEEKCKVELTLTSGVDRIAANKMYVELGFELWGSATANGTNLYGMEIEPE